MLPDPRQPGLDPDSIQGAERLACSDPLLLNGLFQAGLPGSNGKTARTRASRSQSAAQRKTPR